MIKLVNNKGKMNIKYKFKGENHTLKIPRMTSVIKNKYY